MTQDKTENTAKDKSETDNSNDTTKEIGGRKGPDPVRYGDWEVGGKCVDF